MGNIPAWTGDYTAGEPAVGEDVKTDLDAIKTEVNGSIETVNLADSAVSTAKVANDAIDGNKIATDAVVEDHVDYSQANSGVMAVGYGPNYHTGSAGMRIGRVRMSQALDGTSPDTFTVVYATHCVDGPPGFLAGTVPVFAGQPFVASVEPATASVDKIRVTASSNTGCTLEVYYTSGTDTVDLEFCVIGPY